MRCNIQAAMPHVGGLHGATVLRLHEPFRPTIKSRPALSRGSVKIRAGSVKQAERPATDGTVLLFACKISLQAVPCQATPS